MAYLYSIDLLNGPVFNTFGFITFLRVQTIDILRKHVSFYESLRQGECSRRTLFSVLNDIRTGVYADIVLHARKSVENKQSYRARKQRLPSVCFCGIFWGRHFKHDLNLYTNLLVVDIDHIDNNKSEIRQALIGDPKIVAVWESVSGQGLKALLHIEYSSEVLPENLWVVHEKCAFPQVQRYLKESYGIEIDPSGEDVTRHCFVSFDPDIFLRKAFEPFDVIVDLSRTAMAKIRKRYVNRKHAWHDKRM